MQTRQPFGTHANLPIGLDIACLVSCMQAGCLDAGSSADMRERFRPIQIFVVSGSASRAESTRATSRRSSSQIGSLSVFRGPPYKSSLQSVQEQSKAHKQVTVMLRWLFCASLHAAKVTVYALQYD